MATCSDHQQAWKLCMNQLLDHGALKKMDELKAVGYKAVLAGSVSGPQPVTPELILRMENLSELAPAHNPCYIRLMKAMLEEYPLLCQIACFETSFHSTIPIHRAIYAVPQEWFEWGVRRYGFHGASHSYISMRTAQLYPQWKRLISIHLGGSCSLCAIKEGKSIFSSMGATPQSGLFHNNRAGDFDPFCLPLVARHVGGMQAAFNALGTQGGLLGISGVSNDMRVVEEAASKGNEKARLAIEAFCDNICGYIGMASAYLGGLDGIVFTGGIGCNSPLIRQKALAHFGYLGVSIDEAANDNNAAVISCKNSPVGVLVMETNEEWMIAKQICTYLTNQTI